MTAVRLAQQLVQVNTVAGNERAVATLLADRLESCGARVRLLDYGDGRSNLVAERGTGSAPPITLTGHLDTVPVGTARWSRDPFAGEIEGDLLYGRGSTDMKGGVAAIVTAVERMSESEFRKAGLRVVLTVGEETGCEGARQLVARETLRPSGPLIVAEPTQNWPAIGHKGALWVTLRASGQSAHASTPSLGDNAVYKLISAIDRIRSWPSRGVAHPEMGEPTLNVGTISGGMAPNLVPDQATAVVDIRTVPGMIHSAVVQDLAALVGPDIDLTTTLDLPPVFTDASDDWIQIFREICARHASETAAHNTVAYYTDAAVLGPAAGNPAVVICGPGEPSRAHTVDEYCRTSAIDDAEEIYAGAIRAWCA